MARRNPCPYILILRSAASEAIRQSSAGIRRYANSRDLGQVQRNKSFKRLAAMAAGNQHVHSDRQPPIHEWPYHCGTKLLYRNSYTFCLGIVAKHPVPSGLAATYSNSPLTWRPSGSFSIVPNKSKIVLGASGVGCPESRSRASALENVASNEPWLKFLRTATVIKRSRPGP